MTAPDLRRLSITGLLLFATASRCSVNPFVVAKPSWSMLTFTVTGTPASGPGSSPRPIAASMAEACARTSCGPVVDDGVDFGVDRVQPRQRRGRRLLRRDFLRPDQAKPFRPPTGATDPACKTPFDCRPFSAVGRAMPARDVAARCALSPFFQTGDMVEGCSETSWTLFGSRSRSRIATASPPPSACRR